MLDKFKDIFQNREEIGNSTDNPADNPDEDLSMDDAQSAITYYVKADGQVYMDVYLADYEEATLNNFAKIISGLSSLKFQIQTLEMIKDSFAESGDLSIFEDLVERVVRNTQNERKALSKIMEDSNEEEITEEKNGEDKPWIKPSQVMK